MFVSVRWFDDIFQPLYDYYLKSDYVEDDLFLVAALLEPNGGPGLLMIYPELFTKAENLVRRCMADVHEIRERERAQSAATTEPTSSVTATTTNGRLRVAPLPPHLQAMQQQQQRASHDSGAVDAELNRLLVAIWAPGSSPVDPIEFYYNNGDYPNASIVALRAFTVPAGEAQCERVFSFSGWFDSSRRCFAAQTLSKLAFLRFNKGL